MATAGNVEILAATYFVDLEPSGDRRTGTMLYYRHPDTDERTHKEPTEDAWDYWVAATDPSRRTATGGRWYVKFESGEIVGSGGGTPEDVEALLQPHHHALHVEYDGPIYPALALPIDE